jgi:hypothetical protein
MAELMPMADVDEVIADGEVRLRPGSGSSERVRVKVGRPRHMSDVPEDDWVCPVWMEDVAEGVQCFGGVSPVDSLMNAMDWVRFRCRELETARR